MVRVYRSWSKKMIRTGADKEEQSSRKRSGEINDDIDKDSGEEEDHDDDLKDERWHVQCPYDISLILLAPFIIHSIERTSFEETERHIYMTMYL
ncbi:hypothetical protein L2E82_14781 [Cichorium intybus]|uniref:Uncharacterized protein n=1 Tax=Cichorium intybus TaxID=13427 RepID=A0ACB9F1K2_CICIN|nr:hypothetical protein L2E82_14781 [Cichorium intybus]